MGEKTYSIVRFSQSGKQRVQKRGLSLAQAQKHCEDPDTSSMTARKPRGCNGDEKMIQRWHDNNKHWFDGYREEK